MKKTIHYFSNAIPRHAAAIAIIAFIGIALLCGIPASAQSDSMMVVEVSPLTGHPKALLPFDRCFYLKVPKTKELTLDTFYIKKVKKSKNYPYTQPTPYTNKEYDRILFTYRKIVYQPVQSPPGDTNKYYNTTVLAITATHTKDTDIFITKPDFVLVKIFPLNPNDDYEFKPVFGTENGELDKTLDKIIKIDQQKDALALLDLATDSVTKVLRKVNTYDSLMTQFRTNLVVTKDAVASLDTLNTSLANTDLGITINPNQFTTEKSEAISNLTFSQSLLLLRQDSSNYAQISEALRTDQEDSVAATNESMIDTLYESLAILTDVDAGITLQRIQDSLSQNRITGAIVLTVLYDIQNSKKPTLNGFHNKHSRLLTLIDQDLRTQIMNFEACYNAISAALHDCDGCDPKELKRRGFCVDNCEDIISRAVFKNTDLQTKVASGLLPINFTDTTKAAKPTEFAKRRANLLTTALLLERLIPAAPCATGTTLLDAIYAKVADIDDFLAAKVEFLKALNVYKINGIVVMRKYLVRTISAFADGAATVRTKGKFNVRPDFGIAYYDNVLYWGDKQNRFRGFAPYFGVRFNLRPLDPDIALRKIRFKTFMHRSSISIGWSFVSVSDGSTRFDAFEKTNFLVGYGFRINNALNISAGAFMFKKADQDDPFEPRRRFTAAPYISLSVDFDVLDALKSIGELFKK